MRCVSAWDVKPGMTVYVAGRNIGVVRDVQRPHIHGVRMYRFVYTEGTTSTTHPAAAVWVKDKED